MPLRNLIYLSDPVVAPADNAADAKGRTATSQRSRSGWFKPLWVLPRAWCVTTSLQAKGVPRHKTAAFVRLHLARLAPFVDSGVYACRAGDLVHLWFWENRRVRDFCLARKLDFATQQVVPESVCLPKIREGAVLYRCVEGVEAQLWHKGVLQDSAWWPKQIDDTEWQGWRPTAAASGSSHPLPVAWPHTLPPITLAAGELGQRTAARLQMPWAANILGAKWWRGVQELRSGVFFTLAGGVLLGLAGYWSAQWWFLQQAQERAEQEIRILTARVEPVSTARGKALAQLQWTSQIAKLHRQDGINDTLHILTPVLIQQEVALREFEYGDEGLRLTLVPVNSELNIAAIIQQLETLPQLIHVRLLPESDARILRISAKINPTPINPSLLDRADNGAAALPRSAATGTPQLFAVSETMTGKRERGQ